MLRKYRFLTLSAIVTALTLLLQCGAKRFRDLSAARRSIHGPRGARIFTALPDFITVIPRLAFFVESDPSVFMKEGTSAPDQQLLLPPGSKINLYHKRFPFGAMNQTYNCPTGVPEEFTYVVHKVPLQGIPYDKKYFRYKLSNRPIQLWGYIVSSRTKQRPGFWREIWCI